MRAAMRKAIRTFRLDALTWLGRPALILSAPMNNRWEAPLIYRDLFRSRAMPTLRNVLAGVAFIGMCLNVTGSCGTVFFSAPFSQVEYWNLPTGSRIAYIRIPSNGANSIPLIFLHGGPGACQVSHAEIGMPFYAKLAAKGFDVYLYDQIGGGLSSRLSDPRLYTVKRHVDDLEAIRKIIGSRRMLLIGDSWGATLAANYMAAYPGTVIKAIFTSPGWIDPSEVADAHDRQPHIPEEFLDWIARNHGDNTHRYRELDKLIRQDVVAAHRYASDQEMDKLLDDFVNSVARFRAVHNTARATEIEIQGMGWWSYVMTNWNASAHSLGTRKILSRDRTSVLIVRGDSDYLPPLAAEEYSLTFTNSKVAHVPNAGHFIWLDQPYAYRQTIEAFLSDK